MEVRRVKRGTWEPYEFSDKPQLRNEDVVGNYSLWEKGVVFPQFLSLRSAKRNKELVLSVIRRYMCWKSCNPLILFHF